jgi:hypothetical protein
MVAKNPGLKLARDFYVGGSNSLGADAPENRTLSRSQI